MNSEHSNSTPQPLEQQFDRRGLFRIGGLSATALVLVACGQTEAGEIGRVGVGQPTPELEAEVVNDGVLMRTMAGLETSIANAYTHILDGGALAGSSATLPDLGDQSDLVALFLEHHVEAATRFNELAVEAGEEAWECGNTRLDSASISPIFTRVEDGVPATGAALAIPPSDDPTRDMINLVHALESMSASSCQAMVASVSLASQRVVAMEIGIRSARQAALIALRINPGGYALTPAQEAATQDTIAADVTTTTVAADAPAAPPLTPIDLPVAIPGHFGLLSPTAWIGGAGDENGVRLRVNFETPSLNSLAYPFYSCAEG